LEEWAVSPNRILAGCLLTLLVTACGGSSKESAPSPAPRATSGPTLAERAIHRRAVEAVIWGIPAVNFDLMVQAAAANGAKPNQIVYWSRPVNWKDQTLTPNPDTIYLNPFYDTRDGPVVLEIPPTANGQVIVGSADMAWQNAMQDFGPDGADQGKGGKYLITPPGYRGKVPAGYEVLASETFQGFVILRSNFKSRSDADIAAAVDHGRKVRFYPLGAHPDTTVFVDVYDKPFDSTIPYDWRFFESLHRFIQAEPWLTRDKVMIEQLKSLGIEKGKPFAPDEKMKALLDAGAKEAHEYIAARYEANFEPPFFEGTHWGLPVPADAREGLQNGFADPDDYPLDGRAVMYHMAYFSPKRLGAGQFYLVAVHDKAGQPLDGTKNYQLTVPANAPVKQYWSVTLYDRDTHALIKDTSHGSRGSNVPDLQKNADGSVTVYLGPSAPSGKDSNWVPTNGRPFEMLFRLYGPEKSFFEKTWKLQDAEPGM
jgi:hypothetical protein